MKLRNEAVIPLSAEICSVLLHSWSGPRAACSSAITYRETHSYNQAEEWQDPHLHIPDPFRWYLPRSGTEWRSWSGNSVVTLLLSLHLLSLYSNSNSLIVIPWSATRVARLSRLFITHRIPFCFPPQLSFFNIPSRWHLAHSRFSHRYFPHQRFPQITAYKHQHQRHSYTNVNQARQYQHDCK